MTASETHCIIKDLGRRLLADDLRFGIAESCTGGLIGHLITGVPGASAWFMGGVTAYADAIKIKQLQVPEQTIIDNGAVSRDTAEAMVLGARETLKVDVALAVTGIAGPGGGSPEKPVGTVWIAWSAGELLRSRVHHFEGDRDAVKRASAHAALEGMLNLLG
jgi:nicotinamide-nucleotide amidase